MFDKLSLFQVSGRMADHAAQRQRVIAENLANVDTPGYRQRDIVPFAETVGSEGGLALRTRHAAHRGGVFSPDRTDPHVVRSAASSPNGNSVSLEAEVLKSAAVKEQHETALAVYRSTMSILRSILSER